MSTWGYICFAKLLRAELPILCANTTPLVYRRRKKGARRRMNLRPRYPRMRLAGGEIGISRMRCTWPYQNIRDWRRWYRIGLFVFCEKDTDIPTHSFLPAKYFPLEYQVYWNPFQSVRGPVGALEETANSVFRNAQIAARSFCYALVFGLSI